MQFAFLTCIILLMLALNVAATFRIRTDEYLNDFQRKALIAFVWIVPIIGVLFIYIFRDDDTTTLSRDKKDDGLPGLEVVDPALPEDHSHVGGEHGID